MHYEHHRYVGKICVVTGAANGLGLNLAQRLVEEGALAFLHKLRRLNPGARLVWAYGMAGDALRPQLEGAVERFREETGDPAVYYLPLPAAAEAELGSRRHPGPAAHQAAAQTAAAFLREVL